MGMLKEIYGAFLPLIEYKTGHKYENAFDFIIDISREYSADYDKLKKIESIFLSLLSSFKGYRQKVLDGKSNIYSPDVFLSPNSNYIDFNKFKIYVYSRTKAYVRFFGIL